MKKVLIVAMTLGFLLCGCTNPQAKQSEIKVKSNDQYILGTKVESKGLSPTQVYTVDYEKVGLNFIDDANNQSDFSWLATPTYTTHSTIQKFQKSDGTLLKSIELKGQTIKRFRCYDETSEVYVCTRDISDNQTNQIQVFDYELQPQYAISFEHRVADFVVHNKEIYAILIKNEEELYLAKVSKAGEIIYEEKIRNGLLNFVGLDMDSLYVGTTSSKLDKNKIHIYDLLSWESQMIECSDFTPWYFDANETTAAVFGQTNNVKEGEVYLFDKTSKTVKRSTILYEKTNQFGENIVQYKEYTILLCGVMLDRETSFQSETVYLYLLKNDELTHVASFDLEYNSTQLSCKKSYIEGEKLILKSWDTTNIYEFEIDLNTILN